MITINGNVQAYETNKYIKELEKKVMLILNSTCCLREMQHQKLNLL